MPVPQGQAFSTRLDITSEEARRYQMKGEVYLGRDEASIWKRSTSKYSTIRSHDEVRYETEVQSEHASELPQLV